MSEQTAQEPTMEEILASIRRIISEDDQPAAEAAPAAEELPEPEDLDVEAEPTAEAEAEPEVEPEPEPEPEPTAMEETPAEEEVLELTERVETVGDLDVFAPAPAAEEPADEPPVEAVEPDLDLAPPVEEPPEPPPPPPGEALVSAVAASAAASAFGKLSAAVAMPHAGLTLDEVVRELLRPLLKDWLDEHLPGIVQAAVAEEVERIARSRGR